MSHDQPLIDSIKTHFARKSTAQLQEIVQATDHARWSPEAIAAAGEVLQDRRAGRAQEPRMTEEEESPIPSPTVPYSLGFLIGFLPVFALNGFRFGSEFAASDRENPDLPIPFGPKVAWLALDTTDTEAVATALGLRETRAATWAEGIEAAYRSSVFVTPPLADWTLAVGTALFPPDRVEMFVKPLLERLSRQFGDAQYFCTHQDVQLHGWARARQGKLVRGYGWLGAKGLTLWDEGRLTKEERDLGLGFADGRPSTAEQASDQEETFPNEGGVMQLASLWSIDPSSLDEQFQESLMGVVGNVAWVESRSS